MSFSHKYNHHSNHTFSVQFLFLKVSSLLLTTSFWIFCMILLHGMHMQSCSFIHPHLLMIWIEPLLSLAVVSGSSRIMFVQPMLAITSSHLVTVALSFQTMMRRKENVISILVRNKPAQDRGLQVTSYCLYTVWVLCHASKAWPLHVSTVCLWVRSMRETCVYNMATTCLVSQSDMCMQHAPDMCM